MKRLGALIVLFLLATWAGPADAQVVRSPATELAITPRAYPLVCRGGTSMRTWVRPVRTALLLFDRSTGPASAGLAPGQCAWRDRAVSAAEPAMVAHVIPEGADDEPPYQRHTVLQDPARYWVFTVYNDRKGALVATSSREERP